MNTEENIAYIKTPKQEVTRENYEYDHQPCPQGVPDLSKKQLPSFELGQPLDNVEGTAQDLTAKHAQPQPSPYETPQSVFDTSEDGPIYCIPNC